MTCADHDHVHQPTNGGRTLILVTVLTLGYAGVEAGVGCGRDRWPWWRPRGRIAEGVT